jgi:GntR family transcriptional regulator
MFLVFLLDLPNATLHHSINTMVQETLMQIYIQARDGVPIYLQVMQQIKYLIASGRLEPGEELPSIRVLAEQLLVNPNTIARAYRELEVAGVVEKRRTAGTYVAESGSPLARKERLKLLKERIDQLLVEAFQMGFDLDEVLKQVQQSELAVHNPKKGD